MTQTASEAGQHVAGVAKDQAADVAGTTKREARDLLNQGRSQLVDQTSQQQRKVAEGVRSLSDELRSMADEAPSGTGSDLVHEVSKRADDVAGWLEREPSEVLEDVKDFARRRPVAFLAIALGAGVVVGRLGRGLQAEHADQEPEPSPASGTAQFATVAPTGPADPLSDPLAAPVGGSVGQPYAAPDPVPGSAGLSGPGSGPAASPRDGLSGPYDDPLR